MCWEVGDKLIRAEEIVETARSAVDHPVFFKTKQTIRSYEEDCSSRDHPNKKQRLA